ncbi:hypothetical protein CVT26_008142 [Gymnopilus dilepis]|uniref:Uncharacterized protein n=1 Tax=Gymnopilus dilepis TaxID=231916 RepID=A0A409W9B6_9AGAR|nr:hypothetical protein CVT26_008142 [Gymnopilus dilepis]
MRSTPLSLPDKTTCVREAARKPVTLTVAGTGPNLDEPVASLDASRCATSVAEPTEEAAPPVVIVGQVVLPAFLVYQTTNGATPLADTVKTTTMSRARVTINATSLGIVLVHAP